MISYNKVEYTCRVIGFFRLSWNRILETRLSKLKSVVPNVQLQKSNFKVPKGMWILIQICSKPQNIYSHPIIKVEYSKHFEVVINTFCLNQRKLISVCSLTIKFPPSTNLTPIIWNQCICFLTVLTLANLPLFCLVQKTVVCKKL